MPETTIGVRELYRSLPKITRATARGVSFVVIKHAKPLFRIEPLLSSRKVYTKHDLKKIQFKGGRTLSSNIDKILYGRS